ncbi:hypothetical protein P7C70_g4559, partial [Phenoliferia sp. Uapishka_3]
MPEGRSPETQELRDKVKKSLEDEVARFFEENRGQVAIYDANNGTRVARRALRIKFEALGVNVVFIENLCDREDIVEANIRSVKISSPDYAGWDPDEAVKSYMTRILDHARSYETMETSGGPFVKIFNVGERIVINNIQGYLQSRIVFFLMNVHHKKRTIWFARSGASTLEHSYKADSDLSPQGIEYSERLRDFVVAKRAELLKERVAMGEKVSERRLTIWSSARRRCLSTARPMAELGYKIVERQQMCELNPGVIDGLTPQEIKERYPEEWAKSQKESYSHRYPRGESYHDLSIRLEPVILELEREPADVLLIGHGSVIRCLMSYLQGLTPSEIPNVELRRGDVVQVTPSAYSLRIGLIAYRDYPPQDNSFITNSYAFTSNVPEVKESLRKLYASGGGDGPEAVTAALKATIELQWRPAASKMAVLIADAPPHGIGEYGDGFPQGGPDGEDPILLTREMAAKGITLFVVACEPALSGYQYALDFFRAMTVISSGILVPLTTASLLSHVIVGSALEQMDMEALIEEVGLQVAARVHGGQESVDDIAQELHQKLLLRNESTKQLHVESIHHLGFFGGGKGSSDLDLRRNTLLPGTILRTLAPQHIRLPSSHRAPPPRADTPLGAELAEEDALAQSVELRFGNISLDQAKRITIASAWRSAPPRA